MVHIRDRETQEVIARAAQKLKSVPEIKPPEWAGIVKTGMHKERPPVQEDWWHIRSASVLRKLYLNQSLGVSKLRKVYGGRKNKGHGPEHKYRASGNILRKVLQQLEAAGMVKTEKGKGRSITQKGRAFLNSAAKEVK